MTTARRQRLAQVFKALHTGPEGFILPNAWDVGSALILVAEGFPAIASTSAGVAFSLGKADYGVSDPAMAVSREEMFARLAEIAAASPVPVSGDLEAGYGDRPDAVAACIELAIEAGLAGGNIEDRPPGRDGLYDEGLAVERIAAARAAAGPDFVLNARTDAVLTGGTDALATAVRRANLYREVGADCVFVPGVTNPASVRFLLREIAAPLNLVAGLGPSLVGPRELIDLGVRRVTLGGSIARAALGFIRECARELREQGSIGYARIQMPQPELNALFGRLRASGQAGAAA